MWTSFTPTATFTTPVATLAALRAEFHSMTRSYYVDNLVHQDYDLTRAEAR